MASVFNRIGERDGATRIWSERKLNRLMLAGACSGLRGEGDLHVIA